MEFFVWFGCEELQWRFWWQSVLLVCKSVVTEPFSRLTLRSNIATFFFFFDDSYVNWRFNKKLLSPSINFLSSASPCLQIKKILSIYLNHTNGWSSCGLRKSVCFIHINTGVWRSKRSSKSRTRDLLLNFVVKFKKNVFKNKFCSLNQIISRNLWRGLFF